MRKTRRPVAFAAESSTSAGKTINETFQLATPTLNRGKRFTSNTTYSPDPSSSQPGRRTGISRTECKDIDNCKKRQTRFGSSLKPIMTQRPPPNRLAWSYLRPSTGNICPASRPWPTPSTPDLQSKCHRSAECERRGRGRPGEVLRTDVRPRSRDRTRSGPFGSDLKIVAVAGR